MLYLQLLKTRYFKVNFDVPMCKAYYIFSDIVFLRFNINSILCFVFQKISIISTLNMYALTENEGNEVTTVKSQIVSKTLF